MARASTFPVSGLLRLHYPDVLVIGLFTCLSRTKWSESNCRGATSDRFPPIWRKHWRCHRLRRVTELMHVCSFIVYLLYDETSGYEKNTIDERNNSLWLENKCTNYVSVCAVWVCGAHPTVSRMYAKEIYGKSRVVFKEISIGHTEGVMWWVFVLSFFNWKLYSPACPQTPHMIDWFPLSSKY